MKNTRKILSALLALVMTVSCFAVMSVSAAPAQNKNEVSVWSGTSDTNLETDGDTIFINSADELIGFAELTATNSFKGKTIKLTTDVIINKGDASEWTKDTTGLKNWVCSNNWGTAFDGNFDGQGHVISGLYAKGPESNNNGFFSFINPTANRTIKDLSIVNSYFYDQNINCGAIVGTIEDKSYNSIFTIENVYVNAKVEATNGAAGGFVGKSFNKLTLNITNCRFDGSLSGKNKLGGIIGDAQNTTNITNCVVNGVISATAEISGGLVGIATKTTVSCNNCSVNAELSAGNTAWAARVGMLAARLRSANITAENCIVRGKLTASATNVAGLVGEISDEDGQNSLSVSIKNVLMSVDKNALEALVITTDTARIGATDTIAFTLSNIVYDTTVLKNDSLSPVKLNVTCNTTGLDGFTAVGKTTAELTGANGADLFTNWTAVDGDYPTPVANNAGSANLPHIDNVVAYQHFGKPTAALAYQHSYENDVIKNNGETYSVRFVSSINGEFTSAGFEDVKITYNDGNGDVVHSKYNGEYDYWCEYKYEALVGGGKTYTADGYLCDNFYCLVIENIPKEVKSFTVEMTPFVGTSETEVTRGEKISKTITID